MNTPQNWRRPQRNLFYLLTFVFYRNMKIIAITRSMCWQNGTKIQEGFAIIPKRTNLNLPIIPNQIEFFPALMIDISCFLIANNIYFDEVLNWLAVPETSRVQIMIGYRCWVLHRRTNCCASEFDLALFALRMYGRIFSLASFLSVVLTVQISQTIAGNFCHRSFFVCVLISWIF